MHLTAACTPGPGRPGRGRPSDASEFLGAPFARSESRLFAGPRSRTGTDEALKEEEDQ